MHAPVVGLNSTIRLLSVSTAYTLPSEPTATSRIRSSALPPGEGQVVLVDQTVVPVVFDTATTRWSYVSATKRSLALLALPKGDLSSSDGDVVAASRLSTVPAVVISTMPLLPVSVIHRSVGVVTSSERFRGLLSAPPVAGVTYERVPPEVILSTRLPPESASHIVPALSAPPPAGYIGAMPSALKMSRWYVGVAPRLMMDDAAGCSTWIRLLLASATYSRPALSNARPCGALSVVVPVVPYVPNIGSGDPPVAASSSTRLLPVSASPMSPALSTVMPSGCETCPTPVPLVIPGMTPFQAPVAGLSETIRLLSVSVTRRRLPVESKTRSQGLMNWLVPDPRVPTLQIGVTVLPVH